MIALFYFLVSFSFAEEPKLVSEWTDWLLEAEPQKLCIDETRCQWMGELQLELAPDQASFSLKGRIDSPGWVSLLGNEGVWPINVQANGTHVPIIERNGIPQVHLEAGGYLLTGTIIWSKIPNQINLPTEIAIISVQENGQSRDFLLDEKHRLLLQGNNKENLQDYQITVLRKLSDGIPLSLETRLVVRVSSKPQVINFGLMQSKQIRLHDIVSSSTTWFDEQGNLMAQLPVGEHEIIINNSIDASVSTIELPPTPTKWPAEEYWVFISNKRLRSIQLGNLNSIAPDQTPTPANWKKLPTYHLSERTISITEYRRGNPTPPPNLLHLQREIWPRLGEQGYLVQDTISGTMNQDWHFIADSNLQPSKAESKGEPLSIMLDQSGSTLIPNRNSDVKLTIESLVPGDKLPLTGWNTQFDSISYDLHLPSGWLLLYSSAPQANNSHIALLISNIFLLGISLFLRRKKFDGTEFSFQTVATICTSICAPLTTIVWQIVYGIIQFFHPKLFLSSLISLIFILGISLETTYQPLANDSDINTFPNTIENENNFNPSAREGALAKQGEDQVYSRSNMRKKKVKYRTPSYIVQMGTGTPQWQGTLIKNSWPEGVLAEEKFSTILISKAERYLFFWFGLGVSLALFWLRNRKIQASLATGILLLGMSGATIPTAQAEELPDLRAEGFLSPEMEKRLIERATQKECSVNCSDISLMALNISEKELSIELEAHAQRVSYITLPGPSSIWRPKSIFVNGKKHSELREREDGFIELRLEKGVWNIKLLGESQEILQLQFQDTPHRTDFISENWNIEGLEDDGSSRQSLLLQKQQAQNAQFQSSPQVRLYREFEFGVEWQVNNRLVRIGENQAPLRLSLPLIKDEKVISGQHSMADETLVIELGPEQNEVIWTSLLPESSELNLYSNSDSHFSEHWNIRCGPQFHCSPNGVIPISHLNTNRDWVLNYTPLPNEELNLKIERFESAPGKTYRIDQVTLNHHLGQYQIKSSLSFEIAASQSGTLNLQLPENATLQSFLLNGEKFPFNDKEDIVIPYELGKQSVSFSWAVTDSALRRKIVAPSLNETFSNVNIHLTQDSSLLAVYSSKFWWKPNHDGIILAIFSIFLAVVLAKAPKSKHSFGSWLLLSFCSIQLGIFFAFFWLALFWFQQNWTFKQWKKWAPIWFIIFGMLGLATLVFIIGNHHPTLFFDPQQNHWYIDIWRKDIPTISVLMVPRWLMELVLVVWVGFVIKLFIDKFRE